MLSDEQKELFFEVTGWDDDYMHHLLARACQIGDIRQVEVHKKLGLI
jgi:hypothetical protein